jgi:hypothetical protein
VHLTSHANDFSLAHRFLALQTEQDEHLSTSSLASPFRPDRRWMFGTIIGRHRVVIVSSSFLITQ